eukprot:Gb_17685 [translate_table: standard]
MHRSCLELLGMLGTVEPGCSIAIGSSCIWINPFSEPLEDLEGCMVKLLECLKNPGRRLGIVTGCGKFVADGAPPLGRPLWSFALLKMNPKSRSMSYCGRSVQQRGRGPLKKMGQLDAQHADLGESVEDAWTSTMKAAVAWIVAPFGGWYDLPWAWAMNTQYYRDKDMMDRKRVGSGVKGKAENESRQRDEGAIVVKTEKFDNGGRTNR